MATMTKLLVVLLVGSFASLGVQAQGKPIGDLRSVLKQSLHEKSATPRQLSAQERAELRRQLMQQSRRPGKGG
jgi:hypothetical protein